MGSLKQFVLPAVAAATLGAFAGTALAGNQALPDPDGATLSRAQIAYNSERYPVYQRVHRAPEREKAEFARLEEKRDADEARAEEKRQRPHGFHRRAPYGIPMRY